MSNLFRIIDADQSPDYTDRTDKTPYKILHALEARLKRRLPSQAHQFLEKHGSGDFHFGRVFSAFPPVDGGPSEIELELEDFQEQCQQRKLRHSSPLSATDHQSDLLPFYRKAGHLYLFDLAGDSLTANLLSWDTLSSDDQPSSTGHCLESWLAEKYTTQITALNQIIATLQAAKAASKEIRFFYQKEWWTVQPRKICPDEEGADYLKAFPVDPPDPPPRHFRSYRPIEISQLTVLDVTFDPSKLEGIAE